MNGQVLFPWLAAGVLGVTAYRCELVLRAVAVPGSWAITSFTAALFLPALTVPWWAAAARRREFPLVLAALFALFGAAGLWPAQVLLIGFLEPLLIPAVQGWAGPRLAAANAAVFGLGFAGLLVGPALAARVPTAVVGVLAYSSACLLLARLDRASPSAEPAAAGAPPRRTLLLAGVGFGALTNMIYPLAVGRGGQALVVGLITSAPLLCAAAGAWLKSKAPAARSLYLLWLAAPAAFALVPPPAALVPALAWCVLLGFFETAALAGADLRRAFATKCVGLAAGIVVSGLLSQALPVAPLAAVSVTFYAAALLLWKRS